MHPENLTAIASAAAEAPGVEQPEGEQPAIEPFEGDGDLGDAPPHAANPIATATSQTRMPVDRQRRRLPVKA